MSFVRESMYKFIKDPGDVRVGEAVRRGWVNGDVGVLGVPWDGAVGTRPGSRLAPRGLGPGFTHRRDLR